MKKAQELSLNLIIIVALVLIVVVVIISFLVPKETQTFQQEVCSNLEKVEGNQTIIFPEIKTTMQQISRIYAFSVIVEGTTSIPDVWDEEGVMCQINANLCEISNLFCMDVVMKVPVNYEVWRNFTK